MSKFYLSFEAVKLWQGYEKPKLHLIEHLEAALLEWGPFRAFWCMPWEGFLQILKRMFRMCNWIGAPYSVGKHWAVKSVMHYRDPDRGSWHANMATPASEFSTDILELSKNSPVLRALVAMPSNTPIQCVRFLKSVSRAGDEVCTGDWVLIEKLETTSMAARVDQIVEVVWSESSESFVRLWCAESRPIKWLPQIALCGQTTCLVFTCWSHLSHLK